MLPAAGPTAEVFVSKPLAGKVALVAGASRGAGAGIAKVLASAGAIVYVTGRSSKNASTAGRAARPGCVEDTAQAVTLRGGHGVPFTCDHTDVAQVKALVQRIRDEAGRIDVLANTVWGGNERGSAWGTPVWELDLDSQWSTTMDAGVRAAVVTSAAVAPLMMQQRSGLVVNVTFTDGAKYLGDFFYDLAKAGLSRAALGFAQQLKPHNVAVVGLSPGHMRTELVLQAYGLFGVDDPDGSRWQQVEELRGSETPAYLGAAVLALAQDHEGAMARSGETLIVADLARQYGFTDTDGRQPPPFRMPA